MVSLGDKLIQHIVSIFRTKKSPNAIAMGFAMGSFVSILPTPGFNLLIGAGIVLLYPHISKYGLFAAMLFWNPIVLVPVYYLSYKTGSLIYPASAHLDPSFSNLTISFFTGNIIWAIVISSLLYHAVFSIATYFTNHPEKLAMFQLYKPL